MIDEKKLVDDLMLKLFKMQIVPMRAVIDTINEQPKLDVPDTNVGKWIQCSERLPEPYKGE